MRIVQTKPRFAGGEDGNAMSLPGISSGKHMGALR